MTILTVGAGKAFSTIHDAVNAASNGDTISVDAGTYVNDFVGIYKSLTVQAVGGVARLVATVPPPNGKAIIDEGGAGVSVVLSGLELSGAAVGDGNGAGVRYEGGSLSLRGMNIHDNEDGLLANADAAGVIEITGSVFRGNGSGSGSTHNIYVGGVASLVVQDSVIEGARVGHQIKSRAASTTIIGNVIGDGASGTGSYDIDLPVGGVGVIRGNVIQKGPNAQNPIGISVGEEGLPYAVNSLSVTGNTIFNELGRNSLAVLNHTGAVATVSGNSVFGWSNLTSGPAVESANVALTALPALGALSAGAAGSVVAYSDVTAGVSGKVSLAAVAAGGPSYLQAQYIWSGADSVAVATATPNVFLKGGAGGDALQVTSGRNVLDGGGGSNFLVGGSGTDTFFADARGGQVVWSTLVNFHAGDAVTLWGFVGGVSSWGWDAGVSGAAGYEGATLRASIAGGGTDASVTFAGMSVAAARGLSVSTGSVGGVGYLYLFDG